MKVPPSGIPKFFLQSKFNVDLVDDLNAMIEEFQPSLLVLHPTGKNDIPHYHMYYHSNHKDQEARNKRVKQFFKHGFGISIPQKWGYTKEMVDISGTWFQYAVRFGESSIIQNKYSPEFTAQQLKLSYKKSTDEATTSIFDLSGNKVEFHIHPATQPKPKKIRKKLWTHTFEKAQEISKNLVPTKDEVGDALFMAIEEQNALIPRDDIAKQIVQTVFYHGLTPREKESFRLSKISKWTDF